MSAMAKQQRAKGDTFLREAQGTLSKKTWFASSTEQKYEDAAELYDKAATAYKVGGYHSEAAAAYAEAATLQKDKLKNLSDASKCLSNAGSCYKKSDPSKAIECYRSAVTLLCDAGRLTQAAKLSKEVAEIYENEGAGDDDPNAGGDNSVALAIESYEQAAELFEMENAKSQSNTCRAKVAELCSAALDPPDLLRAAQLYEELGRHCLETNLLKFNAKGYFLQSVMCHLANGDAIGAGQGLSKFEGLDYTFADSREGKFAKQLVDCVDGFDSEGFATACFEYDRISKLDPWKTTILVKVKRSIEDQAGDGGDDDLEGLA
uniref:Alpha-soluble NSF attachment protein n=1 Tax=Helicotheca tamesis TaxID=374047 RepID=A0A7S2IBT3_9STRA|eukprot:CAMPEP_0185728628 /NCGR_PEP_ID=MMETSP1171-20130828/3964_1 /TAXON_ID=374046 /ORGANISM="Helicotheca tamensis, Strain CCMP826" /LENGTH=318 /DNA_ID=CAMNT_0028397355 /DNA_START=49 /DNA_END=1005 /DNA_ORIENTATION=-